MLAFHALNLPVRHFMPHYCSKCSISNLDLTSRGTSRIIRCQAQWGTPHCLQSWDHMWQLTGYCASGSSSMEVGMDLTRFPSCQAWHEGGDHEALSTHGFSYCSFSAAKSQQSWALPTPSTYLSKENWALHLKQHLAPFSSKSLLCTTVINVPSRQLSEAKERSFGD